MYSDHHPRGVRAPGRVNLIGEHIDYHDLPVMPMALDRGVTIRFTPRDDGRVLLANADPRFEALDLAIEADPPRAPAGHWGNYVRAAVAAACELAPAHAFRGLEGRVESDLPPAAGLSSSSALVVAAALAVLDTHRDPAFSLPPRPRLAGLLARSERYVGTAGGGMDQSASLGGRAGSVLRVTFDPIEWTSRPLPEGWAVLVAHTGVHAEKSGAAQEAYNDLRRRGEAARDRLAAALGTAPTFAALRSAAPTQALLVEAERRLDAPTAAVARHVFTEADRVDAAWRAIADIDLETFGRAMDASHASLTERCGVGHARLDALVDAARRSGAAGARLTGAGFGGSIVALALEGAADDVLESLRASNAAAGFDPGAAPVFRARAGAGASPRRRGVTTDPRRQS